MKKGITLVLIFLINVVNAQVDTSLFESITLPDSTAIGTPCGKAASQQIGPEGGRIISEDGRVELIFAAGSLASKTTITIQPTTNPLPGGIGNAYQFEPSGIQFERPVRLTFHYSTEEAEVCPPDFMAFGQQDHSGKWSFMGYESWDSLAKTLSGNILHFSGQGMYNQMQLVPRKQELRLDDTLYMYVVTINPKYPTDKEPYEAQIDRNHTPVWYVNNRENGGADDGIIVPYSPAFRAIAADYFAPRLLPDKNPVIVKIVLLVHDITGAKVAKTFACRISLYDEYKILVTDTIEARTGEGTFVGDSASFVARVAPDKIDVTDVKNYPPYSYVKKKPPVGRLTVIVSGFKGPVHIGKSKYNGELLSYSQTIFIETYKPRKVLITFDTQENDAFRYVRSIGGIKVAEDMPMQSVPDLVSFYINDEPQVYKIDSRAGTPYTIYVQRTGKGKKILPRFAE